MPNETLSVCKHGVPIKMGCQKCGMEENLDILNERLSFLEDRFTNKNIDHQIKRIANLENSEIQHFKNYKKWIYEIETKILELENTISRIDSKVCFALNNIENEIRDIKSNYSDDTVKKIKELECRIKEAERFQDITHLEYKAIKTAKPHKCPVCSGKGSFKTEVEPRVLSFEVCVACGGKGIVWG